MPVKAYVAMDAALLAEFAFGASTLLGSSESAAGRMFCFSRRMYLLSMAMLLPRESRGARLG